MKKNDLLASLSVLLAAACFLVALSALAGGHWGVALLTFVGGLGWAYNSVAGER